MSQRPPESTLVYSTDPEWQRRPAPVPTPAPATVLNIFSFVSNCDMLFDQGGQNDGSSAGT